MKILILHSPSTKGGTRRIAEILGDAVDWDFSDKWPEDTSAYDLVILHNRPDIRPDVPTVWYPCGMPQQRMVNNSEYLAGIIARKPAEIWTNTYTAEKMIRRLVPDTIGVRCMLKPFPIVIPDRVPPITEAKRILWYWKPNWQYCEGLDDHIVRLMNELHDFEILCVSNKKAPHKPEGAGDHVIAAGRQDLPEMLHTVHGMVRFTNGLDFGRSTYQVQAFGRWIIYVNMSRDPVISLKEPNDIPMVVRHLYKHYSEVSAGTARWHIKRNFTEEALQAKWKRAIEEVVG